VNSLFGLTSTRRTFLIATALILSTMAAWGQIGNQYQCSNCNRMIDVPVGQNVPKSCPHCRVRFDWVREHGQMSQRIKHEQPISNITILGILCGLFVLALLGGGIFLLVKLLSGTGKKKKRRPRRRVRPRDEDFDDNDSDFDDRPRRRSRRDDD
jgi:hypothetical protein